MKSYDRLIEVITRLRAPDGCPWDREQTPETLRSDLIEEAYELIQAIDEKDPEHVKEEIGDVVLNASMIAYMYQQEEKFTIEEVYDALCDKLIRRHPHVFGDVKVKDSAEVLKNWNEIKVKVEGRKQKQLLDSIPLSFPPVLRAFKMQKKAAKVGFDWSSYEGVWNKINEESKEVKEVIANEPDNIDRLTDECGDLMFSVINLCRKLHVDPLVALDHSNQKFQNRFNYVETKMKESNIEMNNDNLPQMDAFWDEAKSKEKK